MEWRQRGSEWRFCLFFVSIFCCILGVFIETAVPKVVYDGSTDDRQINQRPISLCLCVQFVICLLCAFCVWRCLRSAAIIVFFFAMISVIKLSVV